MAPSLVTNWLSAENFQEITTSVKMVTEITRLWHAPMGYKIRGEQEIEIQQTYFPTPINKQKGRRI